MTLEEIMKIKDKKEALTTIVNSKNMSLMEMNMAIIEYAKNHNMTLEELTINPDGTKVLDT